MIEALLKTVDSLKIVYLWKVMFLSALITIIIFIGLIAGLMYAIGFFEIEGGGWIASLISWAGSGSAFVLSWFLFPVTLPIITYLFLDGISDNVEKELYPDKQGNSPSFLKTLPSDIKLIVVLVVLNILILPLYLVPFVNLFIYYLLNGYLLGREFFELIALRHGSRKEARALRRDHRFAVIFAGILITLAATTPILNLFAPVLATTFMVHVFHNLR